MAQKARFSKNYQAPDFWDAKWGWGPAMGPCPFILPAPSKPGQYFAPLLTQRWE